MMFKKTTIIGIQQQAPREGLPVYKENIGIFMLKVLTKIGGEVKVKSPG